MFIIEGRINHKPCADSKRVKKEVMDELKAAITAVLYGLVASELPEDNGRSASRASQMWNTTLLKCTRLE